MSDPTSPVTILVADDNPALLQGLDRALTANGYHVETASDGVDVLRRLRSAARPPDLLLLDVMMPRASGIDVLSALRRARRFSGIPVILITAAIGDALSAGAERGGEMEVLVKPFRLSDLLSRIELHLQRRAGMETDLPAAAGPPN